MRSLGRKKPPGRRPYLLKSSPPPEVLNRPPHLHVLPQHPSHPRHRWIVSFAHSFTCNHTHRSSAITHTCARARARTHARTHTCHPHTLVGHHSLRGSFRPKLRSCRHPTPYMPTLPASAHAHTYPLSPCRWCTAVAHTLVLTQRPSHSRGTLYSRAFIARSTPTSAVLVVSTC